MELMYEDYHCGDSLFFVFRKIKETAKMLRNNRYKKQKEIIEQLKKENEQLKEENKKLFELYRGKKEYQKIVEKEKILCEEYSKELKSLITELREKTYECNEVYKYVKKLKVDYEKRLAELVNA